MNSTPGFFAIIPANVRYDKRLNANAKLLYGEITALCNKSGFCWAKNNYFAELYEVSNRTVIRWINELQEFDYLHVSVNKKENKRSITLGQNCHHLVTKLSPPSDKIVTTSIYSINNTINNTGTALNFLITNFSIRFEQEFLMPYEKQFKSQEQFTDFLTDFNDSFDSVELKQSLMGDLKKYARNWLRFKKSKSIEENQPTALAKKPLK